MKKRGRGRPKGSIFEDEIQVTFSMEYTDYGVLLDIAKKNKVSVSEVVRKSIKAYLDENVWNLI